MRGLAGHSREIEGSRHFNRAGGQINYIRLQSECNERLGRARSGFALGISTPVLTPRSYGAVTTPLRMGMAAAQK
jgi:hypothetical protein